MSPEYIIETLEMRPHPEGGYYAETFRDSPFSSTSERASSTAIYYLLREGEFSHWHKVDAAELWHFYAGDPLELKISSDEGPVRSSVLGTDLKAGERPQLVVRPGEWQSAHPLGAWTLVGCTVAPGFEFAGFELAPQGWSPDGN
ncbi:MAG: cupin domain-containing protein [Sneathiellales bacterium]|nr:cupin domain-containing protein [Sneathiellales bacterium]